MSCFQWLILRVSLSLSPDIVLNVIAQPVLPMLPFLTCIGMQQTQGLHTLQMVTSGGG